MHEFIEKLRSFNNEHLSTSASLVLSFLCVIAIGTLFLSLPVTHAEGAEVTVLDALFTATSSTCVTGLLTVTCNSSFNFFGQVIILLMIQIGGLGLMTFVALFMLSMKKKLAFTEVKILKDGLNKADYGNVGDYIIKIVNFTLILELIGFLALLPVLYDGSAYSIFSSLFLSISSFCNAGIDTLGSTSLAAYDTNFVVNFVVSSLIIAGGLGFAVWFDLVSNLRASKKNGFDYRHFWSLLSVHSRIVLIMTLALIVTAGVLILGFEWNNTLATYNIFDKLQAAYFNSVTLRTAGFYTINYGALRAQTKILMIVFMVIGASPGGTGGGFKTTTCFLLVYAIICQFKGEEEMTVFKRHITKGNIIRAAILIGIAVMLLVIAEILLIGFDGGIDELDLLFEAASAMGTVGLSTGITAALSTGSKMVIIILMFLGRLGPITVALALKKKIKHQLHTIKYPVTDIIVG